MEIFLTFGLEPARSIDFHYIETMRQYSFKDIKTMSCGSISCYRDHSGGHAMVLLKNEEIWCFGVLVSIIVDN